MSHEHKHKLTSTVASAHYALLTGLESRRVNSVGKGLELREHGKWTVIAYWRAMQRLG